MGTIPYFCGKDCGGDACPLMVRIDGGSIVGIENNPNASQWIAPCGKGFRAHKEHISKARLTKPRIRAGDRGSGHFRDASWDEALNYIADTLDRIKKQSGPASMMCISSAGSTGALHNTEILSRRFFNAWGGCVNISGNYSSNAANYVIHQNFGDSSSESGFDAGSLEYSNLIVLWGANPLEARLGAELPRRLMQAKRKGTQIIVIDPRRSRTARALEAEWFGIRPGTDAVLGYALLYEVIQNELFDEKYVEQRSIGFSSLRDHVLGLRDGVPKTAQWASAICDIEVSMIKRLAQLWWEKKPVLLLPGYSIQRVAFGEEIFRLTVALQLATKNSGLLGASSGSISNRLPGVRIRKMEEIPESIDPVHLYTHRVPIVRWADAVLHPDRYEIEKIQLLYSAGGNFLNQGADVQKNIEAFRSVEFIVSHELFMTPTAQYSDIVLPVADSFEKEDIGIPWAGNYVLYKPKICEELQSTRSDYRIFAQLSKLLGTEKIFTENKTESEWIAYFLNNSEIQNIEDFKNTGIYEKSQEIRCGLDRFFENPSQSPLSTASGKIEFSSPLWRENSIEVWGELMSKKSCLEGKDVFLLLTPKSIEFVHSQRGAQNKDLHRENIYMHPKDIANLSAIEDDILRIHNANGAVLAHCRADLNVRRGTMWIEEGHWAAPINGLDQNGSANMLTSDQGTFESTSCIMHGIIVQAEKYHPESIAR